MIKQENKGDTMKTVDDGKEEIEYQIVKLDSVVLVIDDKYSVVGGPFPKYKDRQS